MELVKKETCQEYFDRKIKEGWKCISLEGYEAVLLSPDGIRRELDLRNDVETLRPSAAGDETNISSAWPDGPHWQNVDEETPDDNDSMVYMGNIAYERDLYNLPASTGSGTINFIKIYFRFISVLDGFAKPSLKSNTTITDGNEVGPATTYTTYSQSWNTNPAPPGTDPWTWDDIDALQIGVSLRVIAGHMIRCTQVYVEVDYTPPPPVIELISTSAIATSISSVLSRGITGVLSSTTNIASSITGSLSRGVVEALTSTANIAVSITSILSRGITAGLNSTSNVAVSITGSLSRGITQALTSVVSVITSITSRLTRPTVWTKIINPITAWTGIDNPVTAWTKMVNPVTAWATVDSPITAWSKIENPVTEWTKWTDFD